MKILKISLMLSTLFLVTPILAAENPPIATYLPKSEKVSGIVMKIEIPKDYMMIMQKFQQAVQANQQWFMEYAKKASPNEPLPYDPKMGITKEEYQQISSTDKKIKLVEDKKIDISFLKQGDGKVKIMTNPTSPLDNIVLDEKAGVTTPYGNLTDMTVINYADKNSPTGPWKGLQWKLESMNQEKMQAKSVKFAIGTMENNGKNILYYDVLDVNSDKKERFDFIVFYPAS